MSSGNNQRQAVARARVEGAFIALAAGDALGWPQEFISRKQRIQPTPAFRDWARKGGGRFYPHTEIIRAGEYSDDTQLTIAIARSRLTAGSSWWSYFTKNELPLWTLYERGGGGATKRAANSWLRGVAPWKQSDIEAVGRYFEAGGNGVAMRVVPHAVFHAEDDDPSALLKDVVLDGAATHGHPRALVGAAAYAYAAWWLLRTQHTVGFGELLTVLLDTSATWGAPPVLSSTKNGWLEAANNSLRNYEKLWSDVVGEMCQLLLLGRKGLEAGVLSDDEAVLEHMGVFGREKGAGTISAAAAIYLAARHAAQPVQGVLRAAFALGADTDTIAAMTGGLVGALAGSDWLPAEWGAVQDCPYLRQIANKVAARATPADATPEHPAVTSKAIETILDSLVAGYQGDLDFGSARQVRIVDHYKLTPSTPSISVAGWKLATSDGQTLYVTKIGKKSKEEMPQPERRTSDSPANRQSQRVAQQVEARAGGVKLTVTNLAASTAFYEHLGLISVKQTDRFVQFGALSLVDAQTAFDLSRGLVTHEPPSRRNRVELHVSDIHAVHARAAAIAAVPIQQVIELPWGERSFHCFDPDGNLIEVIEKRLTKETTWRR